MLKKWFLIVPALAVLATLLTPASGQGQMRSRGSIGSRYPYYFSSTLRGYPYNYGFTLGHYPYYYSHDYPFHFMNRYPYYYNPLYPYSYYYPPAETTIHYQPRYQAVYYPGLGFSLRYEDTGSESPVWNSYQGFIPTRPASETYDGSVATLEVRVPSADAVVWVGDQKTEQTGTSRRYVSPPLESNRSYEYEIKAEWMQGDQKVTQTQKITVEAGRRVGVDFFSGAPAK